MAAVLRKHTTLNEATRTPVAPQPHKRPHTIKELSGQNSNDSSNGPAGPGTPNSQGMRPTPSPTGSTGSRSMSPAVGQQNVQMPPRPSSSQSDGSGPARMSHSPMATQGSIFFFLISVNSG
ncbi:hypothetical protein KQX54_001128 [Cotesia glomerata]|uniref:Uncharacterized protein n=1 Tax=Cotesia glomerata TaxID=32391 RepID=A0AAV7HVS8_COTGL|nr:hypothetical protein KQX54_001128 [Cotesia glomerata]